MKINTSRIGLFLFGVLSMTNSFGLTIPLKDLPVQTDPQKIETIYEMVVSLQIHRGLMRFLPNLTVVPDLGESYDVYDDGKKIRFHLARRKFSDGEIVTAGHVVRTFQRLFLLRAGFAADLDYIENAKAYLSGEGKVQVSDIGVHAVDEKTVEFRLVRPSSMFLTHLAVVDAAILPLKEGLPLEAKIFSGAGPYKIKSLDSHAIILEANGNFDFPSPKNPKELRFIKVSPEEAFRKASAEEIDSLDGYSVTGAELETLKKKGWHESVSTITRQLFLVMNPKKVPAPVRDLVYKTIIEAPTPLLPDPYTKSYGLIPTSLAGALEAPFKVAASRSPKLKQKQKIYLTIVDGEPSLRKLAENLTNLFTPLNLEIALNVIPLKDYVNKIRGKDYDMLIRGKFLDYPDGLSILTYFRSHYKANTFFIEDPKVDSLLDQANAEINKGKRVQLYEEIQLKILGHHIVVPLVFGSDNQGLWSEKVISVPAHPLGLQGFPLETTNVR